MVWHHDHGIWPSDTVRALVADQSALATFVCGGSRNIGRWTRLMDAVVMLDADVATLSARKQDEFGGTPQQRALVAALVAKSGGLPLGAARVDATQPLDWMVTAVLACCNP